MTVEFLSEKKFKPEEKAMTSLMYLKGNKANLEFLNQSLKVQHIESMVSLEAQMVKNLPAVQETQVRSLGQEDPLEKKMVTHSSILACRILWAEEKSLAGYSLLGHKESDTTERLTLSLFTFVCLSLMLLKCQGN